MKSLPRKHSGSLVKNNLQTKYFTRIHLFTVFISTLHFLSICFLQSSSVFNSVTLILHFPLHLCETLLSIALTSSVALLLFISLFSSSLFLYLPLSLFLSISLSPCPTLSLLLSASVSRFLFSLSVSLLLSISLSTYAPISR